MVKEDPCQPADSFCKRNYVTYSIITWSGMLSKCVKSHALYIAAAYAKIQPLVSIHLISLEYMENHVRR